MAKVRRNQICTSGDCGSQGSNRTPKEHTCHTHHTHARARPAGSQPSDACHTQGNDPDRIHPRRGAQLWVGTKTLPAEPRLPQRLHRGSCAVKAESGE